VIKALRKLAGIGEGQKYIVYVERDDGDFDVYTAMNESEKNSVSGGVPDKVASGSLSTGDKTAVYIEEI
jgi:hypothetical protein